MLRRFARESITVHLRYKPIKVSNGQQIFPAFALRLCVPGVLGGEKISERVAGICLRLQLRRDRRSPTGLASISVDQRLRLG